MYNSLFVNIFILLRGIPFSINKAICSKINLISSSKLLNSYTHLSNLNSLLIIIGWIFNCSKIDFNSISKSKSYKIF